jgi:hypothetical protein
MPAPKPSKGVKGKEYQEAKSSQLLSISTEIRFMVWEAAIEAEPIHLLWRKRPNSPAGSAPAGHMFGRSLPLDYLDNQCTHSHYPSKKHIKHFPQRHPLMWLLTNRQIYHEAKSILHKHLTLHLCALLFHVKD